MSTYDTDPILESQAELTAASHVARVEAGRKSVVLKDRFGRVHRSMRISVTDVCNIRCQYCMPAEDVQFLPSASRLSYDQIVSFVRVASRCGIQKYRLTGGEPLTRPNLHELVQGLSALECVRELALTTNGMLLADQIDRLAAAGLTRVNISLDTLSEDTFKTLSRRQGLNRVLEGIEACCQRGDIELKLNALVLRDVNLCDVVELVQFSRARNLQIRFIEFMPLDGSRAWSNSRMVSGQELRELIAREIGPIQPLNRPSPSAPSTDYTFADGSGRVGFIDSVSQPFCGSCDRLRLTAEGRLRNCLFGREEWDVACQLKTGAIDEAEIVNTLQACTQAKHASHGIAEPGFTPPERAMYQIGG